MSLLIHKARCFAHFAHAGQERKGGGPYIQHPKRVARIVAGNGGTDEMVAAAWLHDVLEDCGDRVTSQHIVDFFGTEVFSLVYDLTDLYTTEAYPDWNRRQRKMCEAYRLHGCSLAVRTIKRADMEDNLTDIEDFDPGFVKLYKREKATLIALFDAADEQELRPI